MLEPFLTDEIVGVAQPGTVAVRDGEIRRRRSLGAHPARAGSGTRARARPPSARWPEAGARPARVWELDSGEAIKRAAREGLGVSFLSRYAVAEEVARGELASFRLAGQPPIARDLYVARLARRPLSPSERGFLATLTRCCAKHADFADACIPAAASRG